VEELSIATIAADLQAGRVTSERLVEAYLARIRTLDRDGPALRAILSLNPRATDDARQLDRERAGGRTRGPLHGIPLLIKDNVETADPLPTTAGSLALADNITGRDAPIVARLRAAGAIILGKTNLSEWANFRSTASTSGWSALGGLTRNPYRLDANACGSSSGSGVAVAASLAVAAVGTETDGSIVCPSTVNGIVGLKPTLGLLSRRHIVPISSAQDTAGPMARSVADAAVLLTVMAGSDPQDPATREADARRTDYRAALSADALTGRRLGVLRFHMGYLPALDAVFAQAVEALRAAGAEVVEIDRFDALDDIRTAEMTVLLTDFRTEIAAYLATAAPGVQPKTLADLLAFNLAHAAEELPHFGQELFEQSEKTAGQDRPAYEILRARNQRAAGRDGIDALLAAHRLDALIAPTFGPAWASDFARGDTILGAPPTTLPAVAGYPHLTVPMGQVGGLPVGLSFIGTAWSEGSLLAMGYAFEQRTHARQPPALAVAPTR